MLTRTPDDEIGYQPQGRELPHNIDAEQSLLGAILINNAAIEKVSDFLLPEHFYDQLHGQIFETCLRMVHAGKNATPVTLKTFFEAAPAIEDDMTVIQYLGRLAVSATTVVNAASYGQTIRELALRRSLVMLGEDIVNSAYDAPIDFPPEAQIEAAEARLGTLARNGTDDQVAGFGVALTEVLDAAAAAYERDGGLAGLSTGLKDLDARLGGLGAGDLIIIAGRPSMGKTALATNIAWNIAKEKGIVNADGEIEVSPVDFYSLEMGRDQLASRILASESEVSSDKARRGLITEDEFRRMANCARRIASTPLTIDHRSGLSINTLRARARRLQRKTGAVLIIVDYLQLLHSTIYRGKNRVQEITEITTGLKAMAKELNVPVIALSQLSRDLEKRDDKRPMLSDLRDSGSIEQDADAVIFCYRDEYYVERRKPPEQPYEKFSEWEAEMIRVAGKAEAIIAKNRHGPIGTVQLAFDPTLTRFSDLANEHHLPERHQ